MVVTGGRALVAALVAHGVDTVFGIPGTHNLEIYRHLAEFSVRHVGVRHEQGAGYAADGYARVSGRPGVAVVTTGPAVLNAAAAVGQAWSDSVPLLLVSPGVPLRHPALGNGLLHETRDQSAALAHIAAYSHRVTSVAEIPVAVAQAFSSMTTGRPRPVHLEVPLDILLEEGTAPVVVPVSMSPSTPLDEKVAEAADRLERAERPAIIVGGGARGAVEPVRGLAERLGAPVVTTTNGKGVLAEDHPLALGAGIHLPAVRALVEESDVVLVIGSELASSDLWNGPLPLAGKLIRIDIDTAAIVTNAIPDVAVVGDATVVTQELCRRLGPRAADSSASRAAGHREQKRVQAAAQGAEWMEVVDALAAAMPRDAIVAADSAMVCYYGALANLPVHRPSGFLYPTGYGTLGYGLPAAIGAKAALPDAPVMALLGDGGVMFTVAELASAATRRIPLPVVIVDNGGYGEIRNEMVDRTDPVHAVDLDSPDFAALAVTLGCIGVTPADPEGLTAAVEKAFDADRPTVVHVRHRRMS
ncbi:5-guanidino-2-oxopentanoate decarboxylase [Pseudonocardia sp. TRM90224]|uniref:5-guanidino-2-oxopentanoate decarboxylase n=1 Tax=Pseudonocardia sp. TRM90224 TaxID=2812678 RepID=UPI001E4F2BE4|nr:5-guanidino-2-oxopentanoate decarboxylase [Pseudonocardia sp. TRM90224]